MGECEWGECEWGECEWCGGSVSGGRVREGRGGDCDLGIVSGGNGKGEC